MSIKIRFSLEPRRIIFPGIKWNSQSAEVMVNRVARELGYQCFRVEGSWVVKFCTEGYVWIRWFKRKLHGESQTNIAGPGFHAAAIGFLEALAEKEKLKLNIQDRTGYYLKKDFLSMRQNFFYKWFSDLMEMVSKWDESNEGMFCWPSICYLPGRQQGRLVTHIRSFSYTELRNIVHSGLSLAFAKDFFVWNELERDAYFYRNNGIVLLNQLCYYMPSKRSEEDLKINRSIIENLEMALTMQPDIPFPKNEYLTICSLDGHQPMDVTNVTPYVGEEGIGCRKHLIFRKMGIMAFGIPGCFRYGGERDQCLDYYYDGKEYGGRGYYVYAASLEGRKAEFKSQWFEKGPVEKMMDFSVGNAQARVAFYEPAEYEGELLYGMSAQVLYEEQRMNIIVVYRDPKEQEWALGLIQNIKILE